MQTIKQGLQILIIYLIMYDLLDTFVELSCLALLEMNILSKLQFKSAEPCTHTHMPCTKR